MTVNEFTAERRKYDDEIITLKMFKLKKSYTKKKNRKNRKKKENGQRLGGGVGVGRWEDRKKK